MIRMPLQREGKKPKIDSKLATNSSIDQVSHISVSLSSYSCKREGWTRSAVGPISIIYIIIIYMILVILCK